MGKENAALRRRLSEERLKYPDATLQQIGDRVGLSRERVRVLLKEQNLLTHAASLTPSPGAGVGVTCDHCGKIKYLTQKKFAYLQQKGQQYFFCDRRCLGAFLAGHHGFPVHPENIYRGPSEMVPHPHKYRSTIYEEMQELRRQGMGERQIVRTLGVPRGTVSWQLYGKGPKLAQ